MSGKIVGERILDDEEYRLDILGWAIREFGEYVSIEDVIKAVRKLMKEGRYKCTEDRFMRSIQEVLYEEGYDVPFRVGKYRKEV